MAMKRTVTSFGKVLDIIPYRFGRYDKVYDVYLKEGDNWPNDSELIRLCEGAFNGPNGVVEPGDNSTHKVVTLMMSLAAFLIFCCAQPADAGICHRIVKSVGKVIKTPAFSFVFLKENFVPVYKKWFLTGDGEG